MRPCQNSTTLGSKRYPPQCGGLGTSLGKLRSALATASSNSDRPPITFDCSLAHAPICDPRGLDAKYVSDSSAETLDTQPATRTCLKSGSQRKVSAALPVSSRWRALSDR